MSKLPRTSIFVRKKIVHTADQADKCSSPPQIRRCVALPAASGLGSGNCHRGISRRREVGKGTPDGSQREGKERQRREECGNEKVCRRCVMGVGSVRIHDEMMYMCRLIPLFRPSPGTSSSKFTPLSPMQNVTILRSHSSACIVLSFCIETPTQRLAGAGNKTD